MQDDIEFHQIICTNIVRTKGEYGSTDEKRTAKILHMDSDAIKNLYDKPETMIIIYHNTRDDFNACRSLRFARTAGLVFVTISEVKQMTEWRTTHNIVCTGSEYEFQRLTRTFAPSRVYTIKYQGGELCNFIENDFIFGKLFWRGVLKSVNHDPFKPKEDGVAEDAKEKGAVGAADAVGAVGAAENNNNQPRHFRINNQPRHVRAIGRPKVHDEDDESSSDESSDEPLERSEDSEE